MGIFLGVVISKRFAFFFDRVFFIFYFSINCWGSVVASVVLPQFVQSPLVFILKRGGGKLEKNDIMPHRQTSFFEGAGEIF